MKQLEQHNVVDDPVDDHSTWGRPHNPNNFSYRDKLLYSAILHKVLNFLLLLVFVVAVYAFGQQAYIAYSQNFEQLVIDDGSSTPCIYDPRTGKFRQ